MPWFLSRPHSRRAGLHALAASVLACSCATPVATPETRPEPVVPVAVVDPLTGPWDVGQPLRSVTRVVRVTAELELRMDTLIRRDSLRSVLVAAFTAPSPGWPRRMLGTVISYHLVDDSSAVSYPPGLSLPFAFTAVQEHPEAAPVFGVPREDECGSANAAVLSGVRELLPGLPTTLRAGQTWTDSTTFTICRDSIPLRVEQLRSFRVTGALSRDSLVYLTLERRTTTALRGAGTQFGEPVAFEGSGTGAMMLELSLADGTIVFGSGETELRLSMRAPRRSQDVIQRARVTIGIPD